jgi:hypothetical protein
MGSPLGGLAGLSLARVIAGWWQPCPKLSIPRAP